METCFVNLIVPGDTVVVCQNGVLSGCMKENGLRSGATVVMVEDEWGTAVDHNKVEEALETNPAANALAFVHPETSTGVLSDALSIIDAVKSLCGCPLLVDKWSAGAVY